MQWKRALSSPFPGDTILRVCIPVDLFAQKNMGQNVYECLSMEAMFLKANWDKIYGAAKADAFRFGSTKFDSFEFIRPDEELKEFQDKLDKEAREREADHG